MWFNPATWTVVDNMQGQNNKQQPEQYVPEHIRNNYDPGVTSTPSGGLLDVGAQNVYGPSSNYVAKQAPPVDPYSRWGGQSNYNRLRDGYSTTQSGYESGARTGMGDVNNQYRSSIQNLYNKSSDTQNAINEGRINNALSLRRTMQSIIGEVRQGLKSGGVTLSTMNALDSGAAEAMANAIARQGNAQSENANSQFQTQEDAFNTQQATLNRDLTQGKDNLSIWKDTETNRVRNDTFNKLAVLKADADAQGINIVDTGIADRVVAEGLNALKAIDDATNWAAISGLNPEQITQKAVQRDVEGRGAPIFSVSGDNVMNRQGAVTTTQMPFYVRRGRTGQTA